MHGGHILSYNTDCVEYGSQYADFKVDLTQYYWDEAKRVPKYQHEIKDADYKLTEKKAFYKRDDSTHPYTPQYTEIVDTGDVNKNAETIVASGKGCLILGLAGTGKTYQVNVIKSLLKGKYIECLAPTRKACGLIGGRTIDKFFHVMVKTGAIRKRHPDYIIIDEISMMKELSYTMFITIKRWCPGTRFILIGDFAQLPPVKDRGSWNYEESIVLKELADDQRLRLTKCRRSNMELFNLCLNVDAVDKEDFGDEEHLLNLCYTNAKRIAINKKCMDLKMSGAKFFPKINKLDFDPNSQDLFLIRGMPLIGRCNSKEFDVSNNGEYELTKVDTEDKVIVLDNEIEIPFDKISSLLYPAYCITVHSSQGSTFRKPYTIWEWEKMNTNLKYVALSRATEKRLINII